MDIEQLKMILEVLRETGDGTKDVAMAYLFVMLAKPVLVSATIICLARIGRGVLLKLGSMPPSRTSKAWQRVCVTAGVDCSAEPSDFTVDEVIRKLKK